MEWYRARRFRFKRGIYSKEGTLHGGIFAISINDVSYIFDDAGEKVGWIPATERLWDSPALKQYNKQYNNSRHSVRLWGKIHDDTYIDVLVEPVISIYSTNEDNITCSPKEDLHTKDNVSVTHYHVPINAGNGLEITGNTISMKETMLQNLIETNKQAAQQAAYLEAGRLANVTLAGILAKKFPGLPQTPFNSLVLANIADQVAKNLKPNPQLAKLTAAMTTQAFLELYAMVDLEGMIHELLSDDSVKTYLGSTE